MAEEQKPVEVPKDTVAAAEPVPEVKSVEAETKPAETAAAPTATETPAEAPAAETATAAAEEPKKAAPVEEGHLEHKGLNFPKNFIYSKQLFWFGSDAVESKSLSSYLKAEKSADAGHHNASWASQTGKGLLFFGDKSAPHGVINLADASEPATEGSNKFSFTSKGHKHSFKAPNAADRDNWVSQLKLKIAEAKELAASVTESEGYKSALDSFKPKPAPVKKEEKAAEAPKEETPKDEAAVPAAAAATTTAAAAEEPAKEEEAAKKDDKEEPKRRSASRKRGSIFGSLLGKKEESKKEEKAATAEAAPATTEAPAETPAVAAVEPAATESAAVTETAPATETAVEDKPAEAKEAVKPAPSKRNSIFGNVFSKKEKKAAEAEAAPAPAAKEADASPTADAAPVIPPVETTTPLAAEVASPATVPTETVDATPATNGESKKEVKNEKRKSSLPFAFGKKDKAVASDEEGEKTEKSSGFSLGKLRATIKGRGKPSAEKPAEKTEEAKPADATASTEAPKAVEEPENKPAPVAASTPAVTAAA